MTRTLPSVTDSSTPLPRKKVYALICHFNWQSFMRHSVHTANRFCSCTPEQVTLSWKARFRCHRLALCGEPPCCSSSLSVENSLVSHDLQLVHSFRIRGLYAFRVLAVHADSLLHSAKMLCMRLSLSRVGSLLDVPYFFSSCLFKCKTPDPPDLA